MKNAMQITLKDQSKILLEATVKSTANHFINVWELQDDHLPLFIEVTHQKANTVLELSKVAPFVLLYFDNDLQFAGAAYSLNRTETMYGTGTHFKKILLLHYPISFQLEAVSSLTIISKSCSI
ncbi:MAG: hypothetical protein FGM16_04005 [Flavobacterium sp.]|nr:hypothetical protein [Flavobacterium sp.]